jgi:Xaa-Pro dipeptidase
MTSADDFPRFTAAEFRRRNELVRDFMAERAVSALVIFGTSALGRAQQADVQYLSNFGGMRDNYLLFPLAGEPALLVQSSNHVPNAREISVLPDTRWGGPDSSDTLVAELQERALDSARVGLVGSIPYQHYLKLRSELPRAELEDLTAGFRPLRLLKSDDELHWLRRGAAFGDAALAALERELRPGLRESELGEIIECSYLPAGGQTQFHYIGATPMRGSTRCVPAQFQSNRRLQSGDVLTCEMSIGYWGYAGQILRTITVGEEPTPEYRELHEVAIETYQRVAPLVRPGATEQDVLEAAEYIHLRGFSILDGLLHGFGIGLLPPSIRTRRTEERPPAPFTFRANQTVVLQPNVVTLDQRKGVQVGNLCVVTEQGLESLQEYPTKLVTAGA